jgi:hypothetical protein
MAEPIDDGVRHGPEPASRGGRALITSLPTPPLTGRPHRTAAEWLSDALNEAIVWLVMLPVLPWVLLERRRRRLERMTERGARAERALQASIRRLKSTLNDCQDADDL